MNNKSQGFSIIEALVAIALFGIISTLLFSTFFSTTDLTNKSQQQVNSASQAQNVMESIRSAWSVPGGTGNSNYDYACVPNFVRPASYNIKFWNLSSRAKYVNSSNVEQTTAPTGSGSDILFPSTATTNPACSAAPGSTVTPASGPAQAPAMRRVTVSTGSSAQDTTLTLDILDPQ